MLQPEGSVIELCYVVADMDTAILHWTTKMKAGPFFVGDMHFETGHRYRGQPSVLSIRVGFGFSGGVLIELVQPLVSDRSVFSEVLSQRGPGYHHVMLREDFDAAHKRLTAQGLKPALECTTPLNERCVLFDTRDVDGGYIEIMDLHISFGKLTEAIARAHQNWDGSEPVRELGPHLIESMGAHQ
ncbi:MAG: VOC family protein [Alphaproteobacteria bacterium]|nr:VOC family protein [Alphaproteobacteria bacterium]